MLMWRAPATLRVKAGGRRAMYVARIGAGRRRPTDHHARRFARDVAVVGAGAARVAQEALDPAAVLRREQVELGGQVHHEPQVGGARQGAARRRRSLARG